MLDPWGRQHRPDWAARGLIIWPRGGQELRLQLPLQRPGAWAAALGQRARARLCLRWWAEAAELRVAGEVVHRGDLFDTACRWPLPVCWWQGQPLDLELRLISPRHDDGALIYSRLELEPRDPADPDGLLQEQVAELEALRRSGGRPPQPGPGAVQLLGHAHLDLAWLWPVADTWRAAERTFTSVLTLMERFPQLHFGHSTPALYAWLEQHRPALFQRIRVAMRAGRWEPLNGPWVESDCVLLDTASLLRQFQLGQAYSRRTFPEWRHDLAWLPDSFGFACGLPAVAQATGVRWFCTHKLAWNATNPFPHRLFRWRSRCGSELLALMTAPIGTDADPIAIETHRLAWQRQTGVEESLWLPGVGDHGGGPSAEMLEQLELWQQQPAMAPLQHGRLRDHLDRLLPLAAQLPVWRDELYLELHRGCATSRPDQKRHNRSLERLLREAELARALLAAWLPAPAAPEVQGLDRSAAVDCDWRPLLFQQFHDILPGTSIPEVFEQAEPQWRAARRRAARRRDRDLRRLFTTTLPVWSGDRSAPATGPAGSDAAQVWWLAQLQPLPAACRCCRLPAGSWRLHGGPDQPGPGLLGQPAAAGGVWVQLPLPAGLTALALERRTVAAPRRRPTEPAMASSPTAAGSGTAAASASVGPEAAAAARGPGSRSAAAGFAAPPGRPPLQAPGGEVIPAASPLTAQPTAGGNVSAAAARPAAPETVVVPPDSGPVLAIQQPVTLQERGPAGWLLSNGLIHVHCGATGIEQLRDADGRALLAAPLRWCRWRDRGEFWDAWDIAADHRTQALPWHWQAGAEIRGRGPVCAELCWRGRCGVSPLQLTVRLLAGCPWLELLLSLQWRQRHELLQLEVPLAAASPRWAADTSAGVIERPGRPRTAREQSRWEVAAISWVAAGDLALLLDGPQGVSAEGARLSVSLLRAPTWPDPGADNGFQRQRLALMAAPGGWRAAAVPQQARRLREPLWLRPVAVAPVAPVAEGEQGAGHAAGSAEPPAAGSSSRPSPGPAPAPQIGVAGGSADSHTDSRTGSRAIAGQGRAARPPAASPPLIQAVAGAAGAPSGGSAAGAAGSAAADRRDESQRVAVVGPGGAAAWIALPALAPDLRLVGLRLAGDRDDEGSELILSLQNEGPCRRWLQLPPPWRVLERLDGLDRPLQPAARDPLRLDPWQLAFWRLGRGQEPAAGP
ncbi:MAG: glycoside hydrolase family 38 C-terminal domain-containing protein [Synechococcus sp.]|nr:glycoside hydrolase family 38 C-terminal domain-containing protein [Synechococcus sp.]